MRGLRENLASELVEGIRKCSHQLWTAHDRLTAGIRDCIGVIVEALAEVNSRNLNNYFYNYADFPVPLHSLPRTLYFLL